MCRMFSSFSESGEAEGTRGERSARPRYEVVKSIASASGAYRENSARPRVRHHVAMKTSWAAPCSPSIGNCFAVIASPAKRGSAIFAKQKPSHVQRVGDGNSNLNHERNGYENRSRFNDK